MPELPEVETLRRGLAPLVVNRTLLDLKFFRKDLRFPIPQKTLKKELLNTVILDLSRRGKYLLWHTGNGAMVLHLGMSGRVTRQPSMEPAEKHTHAVFVFDPETYLHFVDTRRFGCILWAPKSKGHPLIDNLGLEPLASGTTAKILKEMAKGCRAPIKSFLMDARRLAGVGNIYACEALFGAKVHPAKPAGKISLPRWEILLSSLRGILETSIDAGGTTLRDFFNPDGAPGYYALELSVYGKEGQPCPNCGKSIARLVHSGRSTFFCKACQKK